MAVEARKIETTAPARRGSPARPRTGLVTTALLAPPVLWLGVFFLVPVVLIFLYSVNVFSFFPGEQAFTLDAWKNFLDGSPFLDLFWKSVRMSLIISVVAVVAAYPIAYYIALVASKRKYVLLLLILAPFLVSYFLRLLAWKVILGDQGVINSFLFWTGLRAEGDPVSWLLYSQFAVILTLIYVYIPFVALPIFASLESLDRRLLEAASDLGASRWQAFRKVTLPLSLPGVIAGFIFVFIPTIGEYFTPLLVGGVERDHVRQRDRRPVRPEPQLAERLRPLLLPARRRRRPDEHLRPIPHGPPGGDGLVAAPAMDIAVSRNGKRVLNVWFAILRDLPLHPARPAARLLVQRQQPAGLPAAGLHHPGLPGLRRQHRAPRLGRHEREGGCDREPRRRRSSASSRRSCSCAGGWSGSRPPPRFS